MELKRVTKRGFMGGLITVLFYFVRRLDKDSIDGINLISDFKNEYKIIEINDRNINVLKHGSWIVFTDYKPMHEHRYIVSYLRKYHNVALIYPNTIKKCEFISKLKFIRWGSAVFIKDGVKDILKKPTSYKDAIDVYLMSCAIQHKKNFCKESKANLVISLQILKIILSSLEKLLRFS